MTRNGPDFLTSTWVPQCTELDAPRALTDTEVQAAGRLAHRYAHDQNEEDQFRALLGIDQHDRQEVPA